MEQLSKEDLYKIRTRRNAKKWRDANKDKQQFYNQHVRTTAREYYKEYYKNHKDIYAARGKQKILCSTCNKYLCRSSMEGHKKSIAHMSNFSNALEGNIENNNV